MDKPKSISVLLIEDNPGDVRLLQAYLGSPHGSQFTVEHASRLETGLTRLEAGNLDAVLLDLGLPDSSGLETFQKVQDQASDLPVLVLTGLDDDVMALDAVQLGAQDYLVKGKIDEYSLPRAIRHAIERKGTADALRESEEKYRLLFKNMLNGFALHEIVVDKEGNPIDYIFLEVNDAFERLTALKRVDIIGKKATKVSPDIEDDPADWIGTYGRVALGGKEIRFEQYSEPLDRWYSILAFSVPNNQFATVFEDITERKKAEDTRLKYAENLEEMVQERTQELKSAQDLLVRQEKLAVLGQLAGGVAHELRTPLNTIKNVAHYLRLVISEPNPDSLEMLDMLENSVETSDRIISSMLNYTRPHTPAYWTVDLVDIIQNITSQITIPENISIEMNFEEPLPNLIADPIHMEVVFTNLISNAVQAMPDGGTLSIHGWHSEENGSQPGSISIAVSDTGVGIPPANMVKLFEPLFSTKISGIGLGLAISKILIGDSCWKDRC